MTSQLIGAFLVFSSLDERLRQTPLANLGNTEVTFLVITFLAYLLGVLGAILVLAGKRSGFVLSIAHQLLQVPVIFIPNGFRWILEDVASAVLFVSHAANGLGFVGLFVFGDNTILSALNPQPDTAYIGINILALAFVVFIYAAMRRGTLIGATPDSIPPARLILYAIAILQILAAVIACAGIYQQYQAVPAGSAAASWLIAVAGIYGLGFVGAICLLLRWQFGIALSMLFHLLSAPVILLAAENFGYAVVQIVNALVFYAIEGDQRHLGFILHAGTELNVEFPKFANVPTIYAVNLFALVCLVYLYAARSQLRRRDRAMVAREA